MDSQPDIIRIGVVADTHVPDRARTLHPALLPGLAARSVSRILHAGDVCVPSVLAELEQVAPVSAVGGNRDLWFRHRLPAALFLDIAGVPFALLHGHGGFLPYFQDKWYYFLQGYRQARYLNRLKQAAPTAKVVVFGHTHRPVSLWQGDQLYFNPGSASVEPDRGGNPSYGVLHVSADGSVRGEVIELNGARLEHRNWVALA